MKYMDIFYERHYEENFERIMPNIQDHLMKEKKYVPFRKIIQAEKLNAIRKGTYKISFILNKIFFYFFYYVYSTGWFEITCNMCC